MRRRTFVSAIGASALAAPAIAEEWPSKQIKVVIPYPPGGPTDISTRIVMEKAGQLLGQPILFDNKGGASGMIGAEYAKNQPADGYTFLATTVAMMTITRHLQPIPFDPDKDFLTVARMSTSWAALAVHPSVPAQTMEEFIAYVKANPGKVTFATPGIGTTPHFAAELLKKMANVDITHVPYRGVAAGAMTDLITGRIDSMFNTTGSLLQAVRSGQVRGLAQSTPKRSALAPELPTYAEAGISGYGVTSWYALFAPAKTPPDILKKMNDAMVQMMAEPATKQKFEVLGIESASSSPQQLAALMQDEIKLWTPIIKAANIRGE